MANLIAETHTPPAPPPSRRSPLLIGWQGNLVELKHSRDPPAPISRHGIILSLAKHRSD
jgi:hypothetical protein